MPKSLLVADDSLTIRKVISMVLSTEDFRITSVDNGLEAVSKAKELRPDLIIADATMPGMSGYEVCEAVRSDPSMQNTPILLLAGTFEPFDDSKARASGANGHIAKPFESQLFLDRVRELLGIQTGVAEVSRPVAAVTAPVPVAAPRPAGPPGIGVPVRPLTRPGMPGVSPPLGPRVQPATMQPPAAAWTGAPVPTPAGLRPVPLTRPSAPLPVQGRPPGTIPSPPMGAPLAGRPGAPPAPWGVPVNPPPPAVARPGVPPGYQPMTGPYGRPPTPAPMPSPGYMPPPVGVPPQYRRPSPVPGPPAMHDGGEAALREALSKASREVIEKIAWEVVPQLAEAIIRENVERLVKERESGKR